jgi:hypothetical protein
LMIRDLVHLLVSVNGSPQYYYCHARPHNWGSVAQLLMSDEMTKVGEAASSVRSMQGRSSRCVSG